MNRANVLVPTQSFDAIRWNGDGESRHRFVTALQRETREGRGMYDSTLSLEDGLATRTTPRWQVVRTQSHSDRNQLVGDCG